MSEATSAHGVTGRSPTISCAQSKAAFTLLSLLILSWFIADVLELTWRSRTTLVVASVFTAALPAITKADFPRSYVFNADIRGEGGFWINRWMAPYTD